MRRIAMSAILAVAVTACGWIEAYSIGEIRLKPEGDGCACGPAAVYASCDVAIEVDVAAYGVRARRRLSETDFTVTIDNQRRDVRPVDQRLQIDWTVPDATEIRTRFGPEGPYTIAMRVDAPDETDSTVIEIELAVPATTADEPQFDCFWLDAETTDVQQSIGTLHVAASPAVTEAWMTQIVLYEHDFLANETRWTPAPVTGSGERALAVRLPGELPVLEGHVCEYTAMAFLLPQTDVVRWKADGKYGPEPEGHVDTAETSFDGPCVPRQECDVTDGELSCYESQDYDFIP